MNDGAKPPVAEDGTRLAATRLRRRCDPAGLGFDNGPHGRISGKARQSIQRHHPHEPRARRGSVRGERQQCGGNAE